MRRTHAVWLSSLAFVLVAALAAGCGGKGKSSGEAAATTGSVTTSAMGDSTTTAATGAGSEKKFAQRELAARSVPRP